MLQFGTDTGSAAIYGLRGKKDVSVFILHPKGKVCERGSRSIQVAADTLLGVSHSRSTNDDCAGSERA